MHDSGRSSAGALGDEPDVPSGTPMADREAALHAGTSRADGVRRDVLPDDAPPTETSPIGAFRLSDTHAYETVFRAYYAPLCAYAAGFTGTWDGAEELVQNVFVTLWSRRDTLAVSGSVRSYLYAAVRNEALNERKHRSVVRRMTATVASGDAPPAFSEAPLSPDIQAERREVEEGLRRAVATLPARAREVLMLRWEHGLSYAEIGAMLGILPNSAKMQQSRTIALLRAKLVELGIHETR